MFSNSDWEEWWLLAKVKVIRAGDGLLVFLCCLYWCFVIENIICLARLWSKSEINGRVSGCCVLRYDVFYILLLPGPEGTVVELYPLSPIAWSKEGAEGELLDRE